MHKTLIILLILAIPLSSFGQIVIKNNYPIQKSISELDSINELSNRQDTIITLAGCFGCGPFICNEIGFELVTSIAKPNFGLKIDFSPLLTQKFIFSTGFRYDFENKYIFNLGVKSIKLFSIGKNYLDFNLSYEKFFLDNLTYNHFDKASTGPVLSIKSASIGFFLGEDFLNRNFSIDGYLAYRFHKKNHGIPINVYFSRQRIPYYQFAEVSGKIGYMEKEVNYDVKLDYYLLNKVNIGIGYRKIYDFKEPYFTIRYLLMII
jgi:hypothetical protein